MTNSDHPMPVAYIAEIGSRTVLLRPEWTWTERYDDADESVRNRAVELVPVTQLNQAEEHHRRLEKEMRESRDSAHAEVERLTAFKDATPQIKVDFGGPVPYVEVVGDGWYGGAYTGGLRGWLHQTADELSSDMAEALAAVFGSHREPHSVITPRMVSEQLMHVRDQRPVTEVHHHDIEKRAEHYMEGYADAEKQMTEPLPGYAEPDAGNPDHLRFAAALVSSTADWVDNNFHQSLSAHLRARADRIEHEQRDRERRDCEWSDYRKEYGVREAAMTEAHRAFLAGWAAAQGETFEGGAVR